MMTTTTMIHGEETERNYSIVNINIAHISYQPLSKFSSSAQTQKEWENSMKFHVKQKQTNLKIWK